MLILGVLKDALRSHSIDVKIGVFHQTRSLVER